MSANENVELSARAPFHNLALLLARAESRNRIDLKPKLRHPSRERPPMLLGQHGRRHENRNLVAGINRLKRRSNRQLSLSESDITAQQPVHRPRRLHITLDLVNRRE